MGAAPRRACALQFRYQPYFFEDRLLATQSYTWADIAEHYTPLIRAYVKNKSNAPRIRAYQDDIVQEVLIRLNKLHQSGRLDPDLKKLNGIVIEVCKSKISSQYRTLKRRVRLGESWENNDEPWTEVSVDDQQQDLDQSPSDSEIIAKMCENLPEQYRKVIAMRADGMTMECVAGHLGITKNAVNKRQRKAVALIQKSMDSIVSYS